ncbi:MAG TPA: MOSC domain-containing protein [Opitutaceae bacterium]|jgi:MOSC domain-containing protein YiiM
MELLRIFRSKAHNYFGHYGKPAGTNPVEELSETSLAAGGGVPGDRFKQQVTFFAEETWLRLRAEIAPPGGERGPDVFRRNLLVRGADLNALVGREFQVQGLRFRGVEYCKPCFWMDQAFAPGTLDALNRWRAGGLRAEVLSGGTLRAAGQTAESRA